MKLTKRATILLLPGLLAILCLLILPLLDVLHESIRPYIPGRVGGASNLPYTLNNYFELFYPAYFFYFLDTFRYGLFASVLALLIGYPMAYFVARHRSDLLRRIAIAFLISMMFLSVLVRVYSLELTFGPVGLQRIISRLIGISPNSRVYTEMKVVAGLLHYLIPICAIMLIGTIQNINPKLTEAAQALGASRWIAHLTVTVPLSARGIVSAFLISYTLCISAFVLPMILGNGRILFVSNLVYSRFSEIADYPSGSAVSVLMFILSIFMLYLVSRLAPTRWMDT